MRNLILILSTGIAISSCAYHSGNLNDLSTTFSVVHEDIAIGVATSNHLLGLGGIKKDALMFDARRSLMAHRPLIGNESYGAYSVDVKHSFYLIGYKTKITVTADIIRPKVDSTEAVYSDRYLTKVNLPETAVSIFAIGDSIYTFETHRLGIIQSFTNQKTTQRARVVFVNDLKNTRVKTLSLNRILVTKNVPNCVYSIGDTLDNKTVVGIGLSGVILQKNNRLKGKFIKPLYNVQE